MDKQSGERLEVKENHIEDILLLRKSKTPTQPQKTFKPPASSVLSQVKDFLPKIAAANSNLETLLQRVPASQVDIEHIEDDQEKVIEMDLALVEQSSDYSNTDSDNSDEDDDDFVGEVTEDNIKLKKRQKRFDKPLIQNLSQETETDSKLAEETEMSVDKCDDVQQHLQPDISEDG